MRANVRSGLLFLLPLGFLASAGDRDFSGNWTLDQQLSNVRGLPASPGPLLTISQEGSTFRCTEAGAAWTFRADGEESKYQIKDSSMSSQAKWEGTALLINTLVSGPENYVVEDRWELSENRAVLTITRIIRRGAAVTEARLVYKNQEQPGAPAPAVPAAIVVEPGTKIPLSLVNSLNTKYAIQGDRVYLETAFPVMQNGRIVIPKGSYVLGTVTDVKRGGRMKGKAELFLRFDSLTLPNGVTREFRSRLDNADGKEVDRQEGKIRADSNKAGSARTVGETAGAGATIGGIATRNVMGLGAGAVGGAAAGLAFVLLAHGPEVILPKGTTLEMVLDRELRYEPRELEIR
jgi:hypothetical protein